MINAFITMVIAKVVTFVATLVICFEDPIEADEDTQIKGIININNPIAGKIIPLSEVNDEMFSREMLGRGIAVNPSEGKLYAPVSGTITAIFDTGHAIGLTTDDGVELLFHIGIDTVQLSGTPFTQFVNKGNRVEKDTLLIEFDLDGIKSAGYDPITMIVVTNNDQYLEVIPNKASEASLNQELLTIV